MLIKIYIGIYFKQTNITFLKIFKMFTNPDVNIMILRLVGII